MERQNEIEIDLLDLLYHLKKKIWMIVAACVLGALLTSYCLILATLLQGTVFSILQMRKRSESCLSV